MLRRAVIAILALGGCVPPVPAAVPVLRLDPASTTVTFSLKSTLHTVHGEFTVDEGLIVFDEETGTASGRVVLDAASAQTGNTKRDIKMHDDVLESGSFPEIAFTPEAVEGLLVSSGTGPITVRGTVSLHGEDHPITIDAEVARQGDRVTATFELAVPFVAWGLEDPSVFVLRTGKEVTVEVEAHGALEETP